MSDPLAAIYTRWDMLFHRMAAVFGQDEELDDLSDKLNALKEKALADAVLTAEERAELHARAELVAAAYEALLRKRGYDLSKVEPSSQSAFKLLGEYQEIHFQHLAGRHLMGGILGDFANAIRAGKDREIGLRATQVALELITSPSKAIAVDKVRLLRAALSRVRERDRQLDAIARVQKAVETELSAWPSGAAPPPLTLAELEAAVRFKSWVSTKPTPLPAAVKGTNKQHPNTPLGADWEKTMRTAVAACLDDLSKWGVFFVDSIPKDGKPRTVAMKVDLNWGFEGAPSVTEPTSVYATVLELLERAEKQGKRLTITAGESSGGLNIAIGRTSMDVLRDTGTYHMVLKAGLVHAGATKALALIEDAETRGVYLGSKQDQKTTDAELAEVEAAAREHARVVDFDVEGYQSIAPDLGPIGLAAWGTREFMVAKPWVEADYRVHCPRSLSNHIMAEWTGALKGLIGLHAFGLRPADQSLEKSGKSAISYFRPLAELGGVLSLFEGRNGITGASDKVKATGEPESRSRLEAIEARWEQLKKNDAAWSVFRREVAALADVLEEDKKNGASEYEIARKMRAGTRTALETAEREGNCPGFKRAFWDVAQEAVASGMVALWPVRSLTARTAKTDELGRRIAILAALPHRSELVVHAQPKIGITGGPDGYKEVRDVGIVSAGTDEASCDTVAWVHAGLTEYMWDVNWPLYFAQQYGRAPMHLDEIVRA